MPSSIPFQDCAGAHRPPQQLKDACVAGAAESFLTQLTAVVQLLAHGRAPGFVAPVLGGASLVALPKPTGGVRPIAVGEILRRLTGKCSEKMPVTFSGLCKWVLQSPMAWRRQSTPPEPGVAGTLAPQPRCSSNLISATPSTPFPGRQCCRRFVTISRSWRDGRLGAMGNLHDCNLARARWSRAVWSSKVTL